MPSRRLLVLLPLALAGCSLLVAGMDECKADADCKAKGAVFICKDKMCVTPDDPSVQRCTRTLGDAKGAIVLGALLPFTTADGKEDTRGLMRMQAIQLAVDEINQRQGVNGKLFQIIVCDTSGDADRAKKASSFLITSYKTVAQISAGSAETIAIAGVTLPAGVLLISGSATSPEITDMIKQHGGDPAPMVWRVCPSDAIQGKVIADVLKADVPTPTKVAVIQVDDPYGAGLSKVFETRYAGTSAVENCIFTKDASPAQAVAQADAVSPSMTLLIGYPNDAVAILNAAAGTTHLKLSKWFFTDSAKNADLFNQLTDATIADGARGTAPATLTGGAYDSFRQRYKSKFNVDPDTTSFTAHNYDAMYLLALAASWAAGSTGAQPITGMRIANGLTRLSSGEAHSLEDTDFLAAQKALEGGTDIDVTGASGLLDFDPATGEAPSSIELWTYTKSGGLTTVKVYPPPK